MASETCSWSDGEENSLAVVWVAWRQGAVRNAWASMDVSTK